MDLGARERMASAEVVSSVDDATLADIMARVLVVFGVEEL